MLIAVCQCGEGWGGVGFALVWWLQSRVASDTFAAPWLHDEDDKLQAVASCSAHKSIKEKLHRQQLQRSLSRGRCNPILHSCSSLSSQDTVLSSEGVSQRGSYWDYTPSFQPARAFAAAPVSISTSGLCRVEVMLDPGARQCKVTLSAAQNGAKCECEEREWVVVRDGNFVSNVSCCHV